MAIDPTGRDVYGAVVATLGLAFVLVFRLATLPRRVRPARRLLRGGGSPAKRAFGTLYLTGVALAVGALLALPAAAILGRSGRLAAAAVIAGALGLALMLVGGIGHAVAGARRRRRGWAPRPQRVSSWRRPPAG